MSFTSTQAEQFDLNFMGILDPTESCINLEKLIVIAFLQKLLGFFLDSLP